MAELIRLAVEIVWDRNLLGRIRRDGIIKAVDRQISIASMLYHSFRFSKSLLHVHATIVVKSDASIPK